ncbi:MAG: FecR family protein [Deltaproteobacteria bacterium]
MSSSGPRARLDRLVAEVRGQPVPEPAESGLPARLRAEFRSAADGSSRALTPARPSAARRWWPALGLAAAALALVLARFSARAPASAERAVAPLALLDGQALEIGVLVVAADQPRHVEHAGRAHWELAPGSKARLLSAAGGVLRVSLEQGSLAAEVEPSGQPESFVVQARGTEVAVHGTRFAVSLLEERVHVSVTRGQVQVRPVVLGRAVLPTSGTLLGPGMQADFWAGATEPSVPAAVHADTSVRRAVPPPPIVPVAPPAVRAARPASTATAAKPYAAPSAPAAVPTAPSSVALPAPAPRQPAAPSASVEQALETVTEHVQQCFREQLRGSGELGIEATTRLGLWVEPDGELLRADFEPPLAPAVESCVTVQLSHLRVARSPAGFRVERDIRLRR